MYCVFCDNKLEEQTILHNHLYRLIKVNNQDYPIYFQIVLNHHIKELSELSILESSRIFDAIYTIDKLICQIYKVDKVNIASLGNVVPHLHWHIIGRYKNDKHFPNPIWGDVVNSDDIPICNNDLLSRFVSRIKLSLK